MSEETAPFPGTQPDPAPQQDEPPSPPAWSEQDADLRKYWEAMKPPEEIAEILGRSVAAVMTRAARLGLPRRAAPGRKRGYRRTTKPVPRRERKVRVKMQDDALDESLKTINTEVKMRVCLMCLKQFESLGKHNRICPSCKGGAEYQKGNSTPDFPY